MINNWVLNSEGLILNQDDAVDLDVRQPEDVIISPH